MSKNSRGIKMTKHEQILAYIEALSVGQRISV